MLFICLSQQAELTSSCGRLVGYMHVSSVRCFILVQGAISSEKLALLVS